MLQTFLSRWRPEAPAFLFSGFPVRAQEDVRSSAAEGREGAQDDDADRRPERDESFYWGWYMHGHW